MTDKPTTCWPWSHAWSKWSAHRESAVKDGYLSITLCWQDRRCLKCGRIEQERLPYFLAEDDADLSAD